MSNYMEDVFGPAISRYTRAQAIEDGVLVDLTEQAAKVSFKVPVACTSTVHALIDDDMPEWNSTAYRARLVLAHLLSDIREGKNGRIINFKAPLTNSAGIVTDHELKAISGPGDSGEHVITIMFPNED